jgi:hypothetical protein
MKLSYVHCFCATSRERKAIKSVSIINLHFLGYIRSFDLRVSALARSVLPCVFP